MESIRHGLNDPFSVYLNNTSRSTGIHTLLMKEPLSTIKNPPGRTAFPLTVPHRYLKLENQRLLPTIHGITEGPEY